MASSNKLSLTAAILVCVNIMLGAGIFINTVELARRAGILGFVAYALIGVILLPLILSIAHLIELHPSGGFYTFAKQEINPFFGFMSTWSYFTGKLASATLLIHTSLLLLQDTIAILRWSNIFFLDGVVLTLFTLLNMLNIRTGRSIQIGIMTLKLIPVLFVIFVGLFFFNGTTINSSHALWAGLPSTLPLVLFAVLGFEAACSLSDQIEDPKRNGPRAIFISYGIVISLLMLYQFFFYASIGSALGAQENYLASFPSLLALLFNPSSITSTFLHALLYCTIASSALGGAYGILYSNNWNLYTLAKNNHTFFPRTLTSLNHNLIPYACVLVEGAICVLYFYVTKAQQIPLQQISALACTVAYTLSVLSLYQAKKRNPHISVHHWVPILGLINCIILLAACFKSILCNGTQPLFILGFIWLFGMIMYFTTRFIHNQLIASTKNTPT